MSMMTAAHCALASDYLMLRVYRQLAYWSAPELLFGGYIDFQVYRLKYGGDWDYGRDIALLQVVSPSSEIRFNGWARIWLGDTEERDCGACATPLRQGMLADRGKLPCPLAWSLTSRTAPLESVAIDGLPADPCNERVG
jgi:hypothetical protein